MSYSYDDMYEDMDGGELMGGARRKSCTWKTLVKNRGSKSMQQLSREYRKRCGLKSKTRKSTRKKSTKGKKLSSCTWKSLVKRRGDRSLKELGKLYRKQCGLKGSRRRRGGCGENVPMLADQYYKNVLQSVGGARRRLPQKISLSRSQLVNKKRIYDNDRMDTEQDLIDYIDSGKSLSSEEFRTLLKRRSKDYAAERVVEDEINRGQLPSIEYLLKNRKGNKPYEHPEGWPIEYSINRRR